MCLHLAAGAAWRRWDRAESAAWLDHGAGQVRRARALFFVVAACPLALLAGLQLLVTGDRALAGFFGVLVAVVWGWGAPGALWRTVWRTVRGSRRRDGTGASPPSSTAGT
ncbi:hypothetical protein ACWGJ2_18210 [Streptomyces sp. NPDC054796]